MTSEGLPFLIQKCNAAATRASQGTQQRPIVDDNAPFFDDFPGYRSTDDISKDVPPRNPDDTSTTAAEALVQFTGVLQSMKQHDATSLLLPGRVDVTTRRSTVITSLPAITTAKPPVHDNHAHFSIHLYIHQRYRTRLFSELQRFPLRLQDLIARDTQHPYSIEP
ncbi:uncharacterized protein LOC126249325 [Schistocerca nitens]|uniref:uncharacterized protein LOC126249325 n=1 Tax=Schistocerca nitens TaxID=7011 RepID=UPI00211931AA|nr:uncharacterized protein LOC126249325 [Schistocerca nitens]